jgi:hypothetical protein
MRTRAPASKSAARKRPRPATEPKDRKKASATEESSHPAGETDQLAKGEVLAAAQQLRDVGSIRVHERLWREVKAERAFWEWAHADPEADGLWQGRGGQQARAYGLLEELAFKKGVDLLESPSFRDTLALIVARRRNDYSSQKDWPERIAAALLGKERKGGKPRNLHDEMLDQAELEYFQAFYEVLRRADREVPAGLTDEHEILRDLSARHFATYPPGEAAVPPGWKETRRLEQLARHLSEIRTESRKGRHGPRAYKRRAGEWMIENWYASRDPLLRPGVEDELERLGKGAKRRKRANKRT